MKKILEVKNLSYTYSAGTPFEHIAIKDISFTAEKGEFISIIGHSGCGKSTLVQHLNGLLTPGSGQVLINGDDIQTSKEMKRAANFAIGLVFQYPEYQLFAETVYKDIAFGPKNMGLDEEEIDRRVRSSAEITGIDPSLLEKSPFELSGGQKRRVALAGVFAMEPQVLVLDEPMAGLDPLGRDDVMSFIKTYHTTHNNTVIFVTHSMEDAAKTSDRIIVMSKGSIIAVGTPQEVFSQAELLMKCGLDVPQVTGVFNNLEQRGLRFDEGVYTVERGAELLSNLIKG